MFRASSFIRDKKASTSQGEFCSLRSILQVSAWNKCFWCHFFVCGDGMGGARGSGWLGRLSSLGVPQIVFISLPSVLLHQFILTFPTCPLQAWSLSPCPCRRERLPSPALTSMHIMGCAFIQFHLSFIIITSNFIFQLENLYFYHLYTISRDLFPFIIFYTKISIGSQALVV